MKNKHYIAAVAFSVLLVVSFAVLGVASGVRWFCNALEGVYQSPEITSWATFVFATVPFYFTPLLFCIAHNAKKADRKKHATVARVGAYIGVGFSLMIVIVGIFVLLAS